MRLSCFATTLLLFSASLLQGQTGSQAAQGRVTGTVLDDEGQPIVKASVCTWVVTANKTFSDCRAETDRTGQFTMYHLPMGTFGVIAQKIEDGYTTFDGSQRAQTVTLTPENPLATVIIKPGPKAGILTPSVKDRTTGKRICDFFIHWTTTLADGTGTWSGTAGFSELTKRTSLPTGTAIRIEVSARGYKDWVYTDPKDPLQQAVLRFEPGEVKSLVVELDRIAAAPPAIPGPGR